MQSVNMLEIRADRVSGAFTAKTLAAAKGVRLTAMPALLQLCGSGRPGNADTLAIPDEAVASERRACCCSSWLPDKPLRVLVHQLAVGRHHQNDRPERTAQGRRLEMAL
jgi:hypothetical protein